jgi:hypothetical protein
MNQRDKTPATHYAGHLQWLDSRGAKVTISVGWAACCSADRAEKIRANGNHTYERADVTCKACLRCLERADATRERLERG